MAEVTQQTAGTPGTPAPSPASNPTQTNGLSQQQIDPNEYNSLKTQVEQYKRAADAGNGYKPFFENSRKYGITDPKQLEEIGTLYQTMTKRGFSPKQVMGMFSDDVAEKSDDPGSLSKSDIEKMIGERLSKQEADFIRKQAEEKSKAGYAEDAQEYAPSRLKGLVPELDDTMAEILAGYAESQYFKGLKPFGDDHPLKGQVGPGGKDHIGSIHKLVTDKWNAIKAGNLLTIGAAARKSTPSNTPAGNAAGQGKPETKNLGPDATREERRSHLEEVASRVLAKRNR